MAFFIWLVFLDGDKLIDRFKLYGEIKGLREQKEALQSQILEDRQRLKDLNSNQASLEAVAREKYYMHKSNETVFVVSETPDQTK